MSGEDGVLHGVDSLTTGVATLCGMEVFPGSFSGKIRPTYFFVNADFRPAAVSCPGCRAEIVTRWNSLTAPSSA